MLLRPQFWAGNHNIHLPDGKKSFGCLRCPPQKGICIKVAAYFLHWRLLMSLEQVSFLFKTRVKSHIKLAQVKAPGPLSCATWLSGNFVNVHAPPIYLCLGKPAPELLLLPSQYKYTLNPAIRPVKTPLNPLNLPHTQDRSSYRKSSSAPLCVTHITGRCCGCTIKP